MVIAQRKKQKNRKSENRLQIEDSYVCCENYSIRTAITISGFSMKWFLLSGQFSTLREFRESLVSQHEAVLREKEKNRLSKEPNWQDIK